VIRIRVLLADDHTIVREGLVRILKTTPDIEIVAEAGDGDEAVHRAVETRPDVVVLDINMPRLNGLEAARRVRKALPAAAILVLTMHADAEYVLKMMRAGASGYLVKDGAAAELIAAIRALKSGRTYLGAQASTALAEAWRDNRPIPDDPCGTLTDREREVFHLVVEGCTSGRIASRLGISPKTVENHRMRLMEKLGLHSTAELLRYAARHGLIT
jgi:DNA-binding NarL/FixJ family response regulator